MKDLHILMHNNPKILPLAKKLALAEINKHRIKNKCKPLKRVTYFWSLYSATDFVIKAAEQLNVETKN